MLKFMIKTSCKNLWENLKSSKSLRFLCVIFYFPFFIQYPLINRPYLFGYVAIILFQLAFPPILPKIMYLMPTKESDRKHYVLYSFTLNIIFYGFIAAMCSMISILIVSNVSVVSHIFKAVFLVFIGFSINILFSNDLFKDYINSHKTYNKKVILIVASPTFLDIFAAGIIGINLLGILIPNYSFTTVVYAIIFLIDIINIIFYFSNYFGDFIAINTNYEFVYNRKDRK